MNPTSSTNWPFCVPWGRPLLLAIFLAPFWASSTAAEISPAALAEFQQQKIQSLLIRQDEVWASCPKGLFRASKKDKKWMPIAIGERVPPNGFFSRIPEKSALIYYYTPKWIGWKMPNADKKAFGLYRCDSQGKNWELLSDEYDFRDMFVHDDGTIYAIVEIWEKRKKQTVILSRILMSSDSGRNWKDISNELAVGFQLIRILQDPDHKNLVCLRANCLRGYFLQADSKAYQWKGIVEWDWWKSHTTDDLFLWQRYSTGSTLHMHNATLENYFDFPFGDRSDMPSFQIATRHKFNFKQHARIAISVEIQFIDNFGTTVKILDMAGGTDCWGLNRILPDGKRERVAATRKATRQSPNFKSIVVDKTHPYKRSLDLSALADFSKLGLYRVQLMYEDGWLAIREKGEWVGSFASPPFEIEVQ